MFDAFLISNNKRFLAKDLKKCLIYPMKFSEVTLDHGRWRRLRRNLALCPDFNVKLFGAVRCVERAYNIDTRIIQLFADSLNIQLKERRISSEARYMFCKLLLGKIPRVN
jgi:hypothetical protein